MSHFAQVIDGIVQQVIVAEQDFIDTLENPQQWIQTSYNTKKGVHYGQDGNPDGGMALRWNFAAIGDVYDSENDVFYPPKPYPSWSLNRETWGWNAPTRKPNDAQNIKYVWNETNLNWDSIAIETGP